MNVLHSRDRFSLIGEKSVSDTQTISQTISLWREPAQTIDAILRIFAISSNFEESLSVCLDIINTYSGCDAIAMFRTNQYKRRMELIGSRNCTESALNATRFLPIDGSLTGKVVQEKCMLTCMSLVDDERVAEPIKVEFKRHANEINQSLAHVVAVPLILHNEVVGVLNLFWKKQPEISDQDSQALYSIARVLALAVDHAKYQYESKHDALTGLYNRRAFDSRLQEQVDLAKRYGKDLSLLWIDIDNFKYINDTYGHNSGDDVLETLGEVLAKHMRSNDQAFRAGGEEFACILPETDATKALVVAERIRKEFAETEFELQKDVRLRITMSIGIAQYHHDSPGAFIQRADEAMYTSKRSGKNRVSIAPIL